MEFARTNRDRASRMLIAAGFTGAGENWYDSAQDFRRLSRAEAVLIMLQRRRKQVRELWRKLKAWVHGVFRKVRRICDRLTGLSASGAMRAYRASGEPYGRTDAGMWRWIGEKAIRRMAIWDAQPFLHWIEFCEGWRRVRGYRCYSGASRAR